jgi:hypothetical protein
MSLLRRINIPLAVTVLLGTLTISSVGVASTLFMPDSDTSTLIAILANGMQTLASINQQLEQARKSYQETKKIVRMGEDAYDLAAGVISLNPSRVARSFESAFPAVQYFEMEARYPNSWLHGSGNLQALMSICFAGVKAQARRAPPPGQQTDDGSSDPTVAGSPPPAAAGAGGGGSQIPECALVERQMDLHETRLLMTSTFGLSPEAQLAAVDEEATRAFVASQGSLQRSTVTAAQVRALMQACEDTGSPPTCQAAANAAAVAQLGQAAETNSQLALMNRLQAIRIEQENAKLRREEFDSLYREDQVHRGFQQLAAPSIHLKADGFSTLDDGQVQP